MALLRELVACVLRQGSGDGLVARDVDGPSPWRWTVLHSCRCSDVDSNVVLGVGREKGISQMMQEICFTGCRHLDYRDDYAALKQAISVPGGPKVFWLRKVAPDLPAMVQFCSLRGRLNNPTACLDKKSAMCRLYEEQEHKVWFDPDKGLGN